MRPVTSSSRTSNSAGTRPTGVVSIDGSTAMAGVHPICHQVWYVLSDQLFLLGTIKGFRCTCCSLDILRYKRSTLYHLGHMPHIMIMTSLLWLADSQQTQSLRNVTPSGYAPLAQTHGASGTATTDQATVGPVRPISVRPWPLLLGGHLNHVPGCAGYSSGCAFIFSWEHGPLVYVFIRCQALVNLVHVIIVHLLDRLDLSHWF